MRGNSKSLAVSLREDNTLAYLYYGGWGTEGMPYAMSNMQLQKSLPLGTVRFKNVEDLNQEILSCLRTGAGSCAVSTYEILNGLDKLVPEDLAETRFLVSLERVPATKILDFIYPVVAKLWLTSTAWHEVSDAIAKDFILSPNQWSILEQEYKIDHTMLTRRAIDE